MVSRRKSLLGLSALAGTLTSKTAGAQSLPVRRLEEGYKEDLFYREDWLGEPWRMPEPVGSPRRAFSSASSRLLW